MLSRDGSKWISTTEEGVFETTLSNAHYSIPVHLLEILDNTDHTNEEQDRANAIEAYELYKMSSDCYNNEDFLSGMTKQCITPLLEALSQDYKAPMVCDVITGYAIREAWYVINAHKDTELLWTLFKFFRDDIFPLTLREYRIQSEQYARIVHAFYRETSIKRLSNERGIPIHPYLSYADDNRINYSDVLKMAREAHLHKENSSNWNKNHFHWIPATHEVYMDLIEIPKILADFAQKLYQKGYTIPDEQIEEYQLAQKYYPLFKSLEFRDRDESALVFFKDDITEKGYKECLDHGWYGFCYNAATIAGFDSRRHAIAKKFGDYTIFDTGIEGSRRFYGTIKAVVSSAIFIAISIFVVRLLRDAYDFAGWLGAIYIGSGILGGFVPAAGAATKSAIIRSSNYHVSVSDTGHVYYWK